jgi:hypothetical protein
MKRPHRSFTLGALLALVGHPASAAQDTVPPLHRLAEAFREEARAQLDQPPQAPRAREELAEGRLARLLEGTRLELVGFEGGKDGDLAAGLGYALAKVLRPARAEAEPSVDFLLEGRVAFEEERNVDDHQAATLRLRWAGARTLGPESASRTAVADGLELPEVESLRELDALAFERLATHFDPARVGELARDPDFQTLAVRHFETLAPRLADELAWAFDLHAALETNQDLSSRQTVLGAAIAGRLTSFDPASKVSRYDIFDLPAACLRWLTGQDERLRLTGAALPSLVAGFDAVDAARDEARGALTEDEVYLRARFELEFASPAFRLNGRSVELSARWRYFREFDAPAAVDSAGTDDSSHLELRLGGRRGWFVAYSAGELPLDPRYDSTVTLGYALQL